MDLDQDREICCQYTSIDVAIAETGVVDGRRDGFERADRESSSDGCHCDSIVRECGQIIEVKLTMQSQESASAASAVVPSEQEAVRSRE